MASVSTNIQKGFLIFFVALMLVAAVFVSTKKISPISMKIWGDINTSSDVAIKGYDPVAFYTQDKAVMGVKAFNYQWQDVQWQFESQQNKQAFIEQPEKYAPQYGGYCSFAVSQGVTAEINPKVWHLENKKLYLFMDEAVKAQWLKEGGRELADANWL
ncbi:MAG: YHS domain-containing (seleno)protein [Bermanella sp.]